MTLVKICGLTRAADVDAAIELGAWAVGFVVSESPRQVAARQLARLVERVPRGVLTVAVFTTETPSQIAKAVARSGVRAVQLSAGAHGPNLAAARAAMSVAGVTDMALIAARDTRGIDKADFILLDSRVIRSQGPVFGGTGKALDWAGLAASRKRLPRPDRLVLAGGLSPGTVRPAIRALRPLVVDVASGVEASPGVKDDDKLKRFFNAVRAADSRVDEED